MNIRKPPEARFRVSYSGLAGPQQNVSEFRKPDAGGRLFLTPAPSRRCSSVSTHSTQPGLLSVDVPCSWPQEWQRPRMICHGAIPHASQAAL